MRRFWEYSDQELQCLHYMVLDSIGFDECELASCASWFHISYVTRLVCRDGCRLAPEYIETDAEKLKNVAVLWAQKVTIGAFYGGILTASSPIL